ncbi:hypothetical protein ACKTEK_06410 [Tepidamorphus sp. 3E244]|uniref:hypothetical protein n=1 Tax=Tepidamorphus sp. 3E244 TaxID=3385498 RepID=UPI0038FCEEE2
MFYNSQSLEQTHSAMVGMMSASMLPLTAATAAGVAASASGMAMMFGWQAAMLNAMAEGATKVRGTAGEAVKVAEKTAEVVNDNAKDTSELPKAAAKSVAEKTVETVEEVAGLRPKGLEAPRGAADDLKSIAGIGPKLEIVLNDLGIYHFDQIAAWSAAEIAWVDAYLKFKGRIARDQWIAQAERLKSQLAG